LLSQTNRR